MLMNFLNIFSRLDFFTWNEIHDFGYVFVPKFHVIFKKFPDDLRLSNVATALKKSKTKISNLWEHSEKNDNYAFRKINKFISYWKKKRWPDHTTSQKKYTILRLRPGYSYVFWDAEYELKWYHYEPFFLLNSENPWQSNFLLIYYLKLFSDVNFVMNLNLAAEFV